MEVFQYRYSEESVTSTGEKLAAKLAERGKSKGWLARESRVTYRAVTRIMVIPTLIPERHSAIS